MAQKDMTQKDMAQKPQPERRDNVPPDSAPGRGRSDDLTDDLRRKDQPRTPPDSLPPEVDGVPSLAVDGDNPNHPVHDDDVEDLDSGDFEEEVDALEAPNDDPAFDRAYEIAPLLDPKR